MAVVLSYWESKFQNWLKIWSEIILYFCNFENDRESVIPANCFVCISLKKSFLSFKTNPFTPDPVNADHLSLIESCLFVICLDSLSQNPSDDLRSQKSSFQQMLHGHGPHVNGANRWFDKTIQLICSPDGVSGICYEHSVAEGIAVVAVVTDVVNQVYQSQEEIEVTDLAGWPENVRRLEFRVSTEIKGRINEALEGFKM